MSELVTYTSADLIGRVELNRPEKLNAMNKQMQAELTSALRQADDDESVNTVVLAGRGRAFCAGGDLSIVSSGQDSFKDRGDRVNTGGKRLIQAFLALEKPIIAEVQGHVTGVGATVALMCDIVVAGEGATFSDRHVNAGVTAGDGGALIWPLLIGPSRAKEYLMTGRFIPAEEAQAIGLISHCVPDDQLAAKVRDLANELAALPQFAVRSTKVAVNRYLEWMGNLTLDASLAMEHLSMHTPSHERAVEEWLSRKGAKSR